ncbi:hypothetical protein YYG_04633 [Plasmodium vinckei petteri]|uniref:Fam-a protein n=1 Tax=Plasmodium vinckei petteri TaxID=138298 RepID=W7AE94_PLAVN|nr:hypothetical protein YYG_04633 [Plasmodium vinckei petteri]
MKVISVGLISLIVFNIVLAKNSSDSGSTTDCSSLLEEKTKKTHKTTEESVKGKGPYDEDYEEDYEYMIKDIFMPLEDSYQYRRNNSHKQDVAHPPVSKGPKKQKFTEKRQLRTINENKEIYQKPKDLLCTDPEKDTKTKAKTKAKTKIESKKRYATPEEIYEQNKHLLCTDPKEIKNAEELMNEAVTHLVHHATNKDGYELCKKHNSCNMISYKKKHDDHTNVEKTEYTVSGSDKYNEIITNLWNPDHLRFFDIISIERKIVRVYNPNLVMIQQRYKKKCKRRWKYFYALATKANISEGTTVFVMTSANINDQNPSNKEYKNTIIEKANLFESSVIPDDDIKNGKLKKAFVNIYGHLIEKKDECVDVTFIESVSNTQILAT